jgi:hypothetical protein
VFQQATSVPVRIGERQYPRVPAAPAPAAGDIVADAVTP